MFTHVVLFRFPTLDLAEEAARRLMAMDGKIPTLRHIEAGVDVTRSDRSHELALVTRFDDAQGLAAYAVHPVHTAVVAYIKEHATGSVCVDYLSPTITSTTSRT